MKRSKTERDTNDQQQIDSLTMANYLMYLSRGAGDHNNHEYDDDHHHQIEDSNIISSNANSSSSSSSQSRVFECKTCNRKFASFQALGGHRASHKKPRLMGTTTCDSQSQSDSDPIKPKTHECTICGLEFAIGQALGGHMRRHRANSTNDKKYHPTQFDNLSLINGSNSQVVPVVKKIDNTSRRVLFLDLNLTPLENDKNILQLEKGFSMVN